MEDCRLVGIACSYGYGYVRHPSHPLAFRFEFAVALAFAVTCGQVRVVRSSGLCRDVAACPISDDCWLAGSLLDRQGGARLATSNVNIR